MANAADMRRADKLKQLVLVGVLLALGLSDADAATRPQVAWVKLATPHTPPARGAMAMAFDPVSNTVLMFGGFGAGHLNDTWRFDGKDWTQLTPATSPPPRAAAAIAYDAPSGKLILFGGYDGTRWLGDSWAWDGASGSWTRLTSAHSPLAVSGAAMFSDPFDGHAILFGGTSGKLLGGYTRQSLKWNGSDWVHTGSQAPTARAAMAAALDPDAGSALVFGGLGNVFPYGTWVWNGVRWKNLSPVVSPPLTSEGAAAYDQALGMIVVFGGFDSSKPSSAWGWNPVKQTWRALQQSPHPSNRTSPGMCFDPAIGHAVLFGGYGTAKAGGVLNDTWVLQP